MPTPLEILLDPISLTALGMYAFLIIWEALFPAQELPKVKNWKLKGMTSFTVFFFLSSYLPLLTDPFLSQYQLFDLTSLGNIGGGIVAIIIYELGIFQHTNIKTPYWLGYFIQRPESHTVHHAKGIHKHNYSDLPIFDIIFGSFKNPKDYEHETGFYHGASSKIMEMLTFQDINKQKQ